MHGYGLLTWILLRHIYEGVTSLLMELPSLLLEKYCFSCSCWSTLEVLRCWSYHWNGCIISTSGDLSVVMATVKLPHVQIVTRKMSFTEKATSCLRSCWKANTLAIVCCLFGLFWCGLAVVMILQYSKFIKVSSKYFSWYYLGLKHYPHIFMKSYH